jgi:hypothetical protein
VAKKTSARGASAALMTANDAEAEAYAPEVPESKVLEANAACSQMKRTRTGSSCLKLGKPNGPV